MSDQPDELLRDLASDLPWDRPTAARRDAVRSSLLVEAAEARATPAPRRWVAVGVAFGTGALAAAAIAVIVLRRSPPLDVTPSQITASPEAKLEHRVIATETGVDELVRIHTGKVAVTVPPVRRGDHVRLQTATAEVEGDAGELEVEVVADVLQSVAVRSGTARVVVAGQAPVFLSTGQTWRASVITTDLSPATDRRVSMDQIDAMPAPASQPAKLEPAKPAAKAEPAKPAPARPAFANPAAPQSPHPVGETPKPVDATDPDHPSRAADAQKPDASNPARLTIEKQFRAAWDLLRAGKYRNAATELGEAADAAPDQPLAADARYWQATALIRAGAPRDAEKVLVQFLDQAPRSLRRGRAAVLLGRLLAARSDRAGATAWFQSAAQDPELAIADAARAGLQALQRR